MAEYDPRPSRSRREHTLDKLRKALPWPDDALQDAIGGDDGGDEGWGSDTRDEECFRGEVDSVNHTGEDGAGRGEGEQHEDDVSDDGYYADDFAGDDRRKSSPEAGRGEGSEQPPSHTGGHNEKNGASAVADPVGAGGADHPNSGNNRGNDDGGTSSALGKGGARGLLAGGGDVDSAGKYVGVACGGGGAEEVHPESPPRPRVPPVSGSDDDGKECAVKLAAKANDEIAVREDQGQAGVAATEGPMKRPATGQRKARREANTARVNCQS